LIGRIAADTTTAARRPRLGKTGTTDDVAEILRQREPIYCQCADFQVDTEEKSPPQVAEEIAAWLEQK
jgi:shikimate kinase